MTQIEKEELENMIKGLLEQNNSMIKDMLEQNNSMLLENISSLINKEEQNSKKEYSKWRTQIRDNAESVAKQAGYSNTRQVFHEIYQIMSSEYGHNLNLDWFTKQYQTAHPNERISTFDVIEAYQELKDTFTYIFNNFLKEKEKWKKIRDEKEPSWIRG